MNRAEPALRITCPGGLRRVGVVYGHDHIARRNPSLQALEDPHTSRIASVACSAEFYPEATVKRAERGPLPFVGERIIVCVALAGSPRRNFGHDFWQLSSDQAQRPL